MKIVYCIHSTFNSGGMERVLANKVNYWVEHGYDVCIITTEQQGKSPFFLMPSKVNCFDLGINYSLDNGKGILIKGLTFLRKQWIHKHRLEQLLLSLKADIVVSMFGNEATFLPAIKDGSKKILEIHFSKFFRLQNERRGLWRLVDNCRSYWDEIKVRRYDRFVVLTEEDKEHWGNLSNITVIPNFIIPFSDKMSFLEVKKVIAVGRLSNQKGYDLLISTWEEVAQLFPNWKLEIYGSGELQESLMREIRARHLEDFIKICRPTNNIGNVYLESSVLVLSSRYEGLPMVLLEAMSCGVPPVAFACKCGPRDLITHNVNGLLIENGNIEKLAEGLITVISDIDFRKRLGHEAYKRSLDFSQEKIMLKWEILFSELVK